MPAFIGHVTTVEAALGMIKTGGYDNSSGRPGTIGIGIYGFAMDLQEETQTGSGAHTFLALM